MDAVKKERSKVLKVLAELCVKSGFEQAVNAAQTSDLWGTGFR